MSRCAPCGTSWTGLKPEHCPACHETFGGTRTGDMHRFGSFDDGSRRCLSVEELRSAGLRPDSSGIWRRDAPSYCQSGSPGGAPGIPGPRTAPDGLRQSERRFGATA